MCPMTIFAMWLGLLVAGPATGQRDALPPPASVAGEIPDATGADMGLALGAGPAFQIGRSLLQQGKPEEALPYLNHAFRLAPDVERTAAAYLDVLVQTGYESDAMTIASRLVRLHPEDTAYHRRYAVLLARAGNYQAALDEVAAVRRGGIDDVDLVKLEAELRERLDEPDRALTLLADAEKRFADAREELVLAEAGVLRRAHRLDALQALLEDRLAALPRSDAIRQALLRTLIEQQDLAAALRVAQAGDRQRDRDPTGGPGFQVQLADMLARQSRFDAAIDVLTDLRARGEADQTAQLWLGRLLLGVGRPRQAADLLADVAARWPRLGEAEYLWGKAVLADTDTTGGLEHLRRAVVLDPGRTEFRLTLLQELLLVARPALSAPNPSPDDRKLRDEVRAHAREASAQLGADDASGHLILGYTYQALGELREAARHFEAAGEVNDIRRQAMLELSLCLDELGDRDKARTTLEKLRTEYPDDPEVANSLGYYLAEQDADLERAEKLVRQALKSDPNNGAYLDSLGWVLYKRGRHAEAFDQMIEAVNQRPSDPIILEHLGLILKALGRSKEALDMLRRSVDAGATSDRLQTAIKELENDEH